ncbi:MAG: entericidin EcnAB [Campylobacterota bacterium]|nr:entericidin EcnAB [Campylobacterota bacterium]
MKNTILIAFASIMLFSGCATWEGLQQDSSDAWDASKEAFENRRAQ